MENIRLIGSLDDCIIREDEEVPNVGVIPKPKIIFQDLVFTLKYNSGNFFAPYVKMGRGKLVLLGHHIFWKAVKKAGYDKIEFNLFYDNQYQLEQVMKKYDFKKAQPLQPLKEGYPIKNFVFFEEKPIIVNPNNDRIKLYSQNESGEFRDMRCIGFDLLSDNDYKWNEYSYIRKLVKRNGKLRSKDGFLPSEKFYHDYERD